MGFKLNQDADPSGTCLQGKITLRHADIVAAFGEGIDGGDKTTQEWTFEGPKGQTFTLYDWKTSSTPTGSYDWHIGGHSGQDLSGFKSWLKAKVG